MKKIKTKIGISFTVVIAFFLMAFTSNFFEIAKQIDIYTSLFKEVNMHYVDPINPAKMTKLALDNMLKNLDPYTRFYDEQGVEDARISTTGEYGGIGTRIVYKNKKMTLREVFKNSPAQKAGLKAGDQIVQINDAIVKEYEGDNVLTLLKGMPGTKVLLKIKRQNKEIDINVSRAKIVRKAVPYYTLVNDDIGYISFKKFTNKASKEVKDAYEDLKEQGMKKMILDLRGNPGGLLNEAVKIVNLFVPKNKTVVFTKGKIQEHNKTYKTTSKPIDLEIPITILIDGRSASASEIVSGALQDYDRAVIIGQRSFGKGLVQRYYKLPYGTQSKITIARYYIPSGRCIQKLDYSHRDESGKVPEFSNAQVYSTENGRKVYGGGGVLPDVILEQLELTSTTKKLLKSEVPFLFAVDYSYKHPAVSKPSSLQLPTTIFSEFTTFANLHQKDFITNTEKQLKKATEISEKENLQLKESGDYKKMLASIHKQKIEELNKNKNQIVEVITEEIVKCNYYEEGVFKHKIAFDNTLKKAISILNNSKNYKKILK